MSTHDCLGLTLVQKPSTQTWRRIGDEYDMQLPVVLGQQSINHVYNETSENLLHLAGMSFCIQDREVSLIIQGLPGVIAFEFR